MKGGGGYGETRRIIQRERLRKSRRGCGSGVFGYSNRRGRDLSCQGCQCAQGQQHTNTVRPQQMAEEATTERRRLNLKPRTEAGVKAAEQERADKKGGIFGAAKPREQVLAKREGVDETELLKTEAEKFRRSLRLNETQRNEKTAAEEAIKLAKSELEEKPDDEALKKTVEEKEAELEALMSSFEKVAVETAHKGGLRIDREKNESSSEHINNDGAGSAKGMQQNHHMYHNNNNNNNNSNNPNFAHGQHPQQYFNGNGGGGRMNNDHFRGGGYDQGGYRGRGGHDFNGRDDRGYGGGGGGNFRGNGYDPRDGRGGGGGYGYDGRGGGGNFRGNGYDARDRGGNPQPGGGYEGRGGGYEGRGGGYDYRGGGGGGGGYGYDQRGGGGNYGGQYDGRGNRGGGQFDGRGGGRGGGGGSWRSGGDNTRAGEKRDDRKW